MTARNCGSEVNRVANSDFFSSFSFFIFRRGPRFICFEKYEVCLWFEFGLVTDYLIKRGFWACVSGILNRRVIARAGERRRIINCKEILVVMQLHSWSEFLFVFATFPNFLI